MPLHYYRIEEINCITTCNFLHCSNNFILVNESVKHTKTFLSKVFFNILLTITLS